MPRRERTTIMGDILEALYRTAGARGERKLSHVAVRCNLPYDRFREYLHELQGLGLVDPEEPFRLTPAGRRFLAAHQAWQESLRLFGMAPPE